MVSATIKANAVAVVTAPPAADNTVTNIDDALTVADIIFNTANTAANVTAAAVTFQCCPPIEKVFTRPSGRQEEEARLHVCADSRSLDRSSVADGGGTQYCQNTCGTTTAAPTHLRASDLSGGGRGLSANLVCRGGRFGAFKDLDGCRAQIGRWASRDWHVRHRITSSRSEPDLGRCTFSLLLFFLFV